MAVGVASRLAAAAARRRGAAGRRVRVAPAGPPLDHDHEGSRDPTGAKDVPRKAVRAHGDLLGAALASGDPTGGSAKPDVAQAFASCSGALADRRRRHSAGTTATPIIVTSATAKSSGYEPNP